MTPIELIAGIVGIEKADQIVEALTRAGYTIQIQTVIDRMMDAAGFEHVEREQ